MFADRSRIAQTDGWSKLNLIEVERQTDYRGDHSQIALSLRELPIRFNFHKSLTNNALFHVWRHHAF